MRALILGGSGMIGHKLCELLAKQMEVWATFRTVTPQYRYLPVKRQIRHVSVGDLSRIVDVLSEIKPDAVVNAVGIIKQRDEAMNVVSSIQVNSLFPHQLADMCVQRDIRVIQFSTDCVFSGHHGNYTELNNPDPVDLYGRSKLLGEVNRRGTLTLRTSTIGWQLSSFTSLLSWFALQRGKRIKGFCNAIYSGISTSVLSQLIGDILLSRPDLTGIYQVASEPISKFDLLMKFRETLDWKDIEIDPDLDYFCNRSLSSTKFNSVTGWSAPVWDSMIDSLANEWPDYQIYYRDHDSLE